MTKIQALIVGTQKGGTTALHHFLEQHPDISGPMGAKELHFFDNDSLNWSAPPYEQYEASFRDDGRLHFESTPIYMWWLPCMGRIAKYNPQMKIIVLLRDPVERAYSHWWMEKQRGRETLSFADAVREELYKRGTISAPSRIQSYVSRGEYLRQIKNIYQHFPSKQTRIIKSSALQNRHEYVWQVVQEFLEIKDADPPAQEMIFAQNYPAMTDEDYHVAEAALFDSGNDCLLRWLCWSGW